MIRKCFIDVETTGLDPNKHGIHQIAGILASTNDEGQTKEDRFNFHVQPIPGDEIDHRALEVSGVTLEMVMSGQDTSSVKKELETLMEGHVGRYNKYEKFFFIAYNASFDNEFMRIWYAKHNDRYFGSWFWTPYIDVMQVAALYLLKRRHEMKNFKLATVAEMLGIELKEVRMHDASYYVEITKQIWDMIMKR